MKKIFLSFLAIMAMVGMVSAQRTWAYGLNMTQEGENYTFVFKSTTAATAANLVFTDAAGEVAGKVALENVVAGENTKVLALADIPGEGTLNWAVELTGAAIDEVTKLTDDSKYDGFWFAYGVGVNNNPESDYFGNIYVSNPRHSSAPAQTGFYKYSPELVLDSTLFEDGTKVGYKPSNVTLANAVDAIQRMAVSPVDGTVAFVQWNAAPFAAYGMNPANLAGEAVNLTEGINQPVALCYDHEGSLCVLSYDGKEGGVSVYALYIIKDGEITKFFSQAGWVAGGYCEIASDGQGGFYVMSGVLNASNVVTAAKLQHISKNAEIDLTVLPGGAELAEAPATFNRLRLAYDLKHDVLAIGGGKKVNLYNATYAAETGAPTLTKWTATSELTTNIDGIAFDYAGDLYVVSAGTETFYKFALPTANNTCTTPAKKAQVIEKEVAPVVVTETFDLTQEDTRNMGAYVIFAGDYTLRIYGYTGAGTYQDDPATEEDAAPLLFTPDYEDPLNAVVVVTIDEENNKEVMQVTATSADGKKIYNLTINIALPSYEKYSLIATGIQAENDEVEGMSVIKLKGEGYLNGEETVPFEFMVFESMMGYGAEGTIGETYAFSTVAEFFAEDGGFVFMATMQDEEGKYLFNVEVMGTMPKAEVEIVVKETKDVTLYNLNMNVQGNMAMVTAEGETLSFWLTLLETENYYGTYTNDAFSNIWYGDDQLYAAYGEAQVYAEVDGKAKFVVSFISTPDAEGNVTLYNFTLIPGEKPAEPTKHTVTIVVTPEGAGTVTGAGEYEDGAEVTVTAKENGDEWLFMGWMDPATEEFVANDYTYTFTITEDVTLIAYYLLAMEGESNDLVIGENTLTASAQLSIGLLKMNLVLGEEEKGMYWLAEESTLTVDDKAAILVEGVAQVDVANHFAATSFVAQYNDALYYISVVMYAPATGVDNINTTVVPVKMIENGQLIIMNGDAKYNVQGALVK